jgi:AcrR family transcriptional regulator
MAPHERTTAELDLIWLRPNRARRGPKPTLSREQITQTAIELADSDGLDAVSMRRIAARLGAGATSLYWHVVSKDDLYELMVDEVIGEIELPERSGDWQADLRGIAESTHAVLMRHRWLVLLGIQPGLGPKTQRYGQTALGSLEGLGLDVASRTNILAAVNNYLFGFIHREIAWEQLRQRSGLTNKQWTSRLRHYLHGASAGDPLLATQIEARLRLATHESFEFGLDCLLQGIAAHATRKQRDRDPSPPSESSAAAQLPRQPPPAR